MVQMDAELSARFARSCTNAALGYVRAASAAYVAFADQALNFWSATTAATHDSSGPRSHLRLVSGPRPYRSAVSADHVMPGTSSDFSRLSNAWAEQAVFGPVRAWWSLYPFDTNPQTWPMAYAMISAGVPRAVAVPTAEANLAAMDAAQLASDSIRNTFSSYRSYGGHAVPPSTPQEWFAHFFQTPAAKFPWA